MRASQCVSADRVFINGQVLTLETAEKSCSGLAIKEGLICGLGDTEQVKHLIGPHTQVTDLQGKTLMPGLIDGHAHLDREGLKQLLPNFHGCTSIDEVIQRLRQLAAHTKSGEWIITMPLGEYPEYRWSDDMYQEGRLPHRFDLDQASAEHPILIRCAWGYWPRQTPMVTIANSAALALAGIDQTTVSPSANLVIEKDSQGQLTGRFFEHSLQPLAEFSLLKNAPHFDQHDRVVGLRASMQAYHAVGTTGVFEGHGVSEETYRAYQLAQQRHQLSMRARLAFSPGWTGATNEDIRAWVLEQAKYLAGKGSGDDWLRLAGIYVEPQADYADNQIRAACYPQTGWAGFRYDAGLSEDKLMLLLEQAARAGLQVNGIQTAMARRFMQVAKRYPIDDLRWVVSHPSVFTQEDIAGLAANGIGVTTLTNTWIWRRGSLVLDEIGPENEDRICPLKSLVQAGVPTAFASDNQPISLWNSVWQAVQRLDRSTQRVIAPKQCLSRHEALRCASTHGAWLSFDEEQRGSLKVGKQADLIILEDDPLKIDITKLATLQPIETIVDGQTVWASPKQEN